VPVQPKAFGKYTLLRELGRGGMGVVYEAQDSQLGRAVALKLLLTENLKDPSTRAIEEERFVREAQLSAKLRHPHIVTVYEAGTIDGRRYLSMEFVEGVSLARWLKRQPAPTLKQKIAVLRDVARAVAHAHAAGVLHRDLKPQNILMDREDQPFVSDFGLAKGSGPESSASLTVSGSVVGTPSYMSPEQARGLKTVNIRTDIYALGVMLYEMLAGRVPFLGDSPIDVMMKVVKNPAPAPSTVAKTWQASPSWIALESVCLKAMAKDPRQRHSSASALADDLDRWMNGTLLPAAPPRSRNPLWLWGGAAALAVALGVALLSASGSGSGSSDPKALSRAPKPPPNPPAAAVDRDAKAAGEETERLRRENSREREESLLREAERSKRDLEDKRTLELEKTALAQKLKEAEERARLAEEATRTAEKRPAPEPTTASAPASEGKAPDPVPAPAPASAPAAGLPPRALPGAESQPRKLPEPGTSDRKAAEKAIQSRFKSDFARKQAADRRSLAGKLLDLGLKEGEEPANRFELLQEARDLAVQAGDAELASAAVSALVQGFSVDPKPLRSQTLQALGKTALTPSALREGLGVAMRFSADAAREDEYDAALQLLAQGELLARRAKDEAGVAAVADRIRDLTEIRKDWTRVRSFFKTLQERPDDPAANLVAGRFLCLMKQDWERGLPYLARGSDDGLKAAALKELGTKGPEEDVASADSWAAVTEKQWLPRTRLGEHAQALYQRAWPKLEGATRESVRARLKAAAIRTGRTAPGLPAQWALWEDAQKDPFSLDEKLAHGGRASLRIGPYPKSGMIYLSVKKSAPGRRCTFSAWCFADGTEAQDGVVAVGTSDGVNDASAKQFPLRAPADQPWWTFLQTSFTIPEDGAVMNLYIPYGWNAGTLWLDDVSCKLDDGTELIDNGGFEK